MSELADRGLDSLLDRYFDLHKIPDSEQRAIRSMEGLRELSNPKLSNSEKERKVKQVVDGITTTLPSINDPFRLAEDAGMLMLYGVTRNANLLEYWGENPATAARLRPAAQAVYDMLGKASKAATDQAGQLASKINIQQSVHGRSRVGQGQQSRPDRAIQPGDDGLLPRPGDAASASGPRWWTRR